MSELDERKAAVDPSGFIDSARILSALEEIRDRLGAVEAKLEELHDRLLEIIEK